MSEAGRNPFKIDKSDKRKYPVVRDRFIDFDLFYRFFCHSVKFIIVY